MLKKKPESTSSICEMLSYVNGSSYEVVMLTGHQRGEIFMGVYKVTILVIQLSLTKVRLSLQAQMGKYFATLRNPTLNLTLRS